MTELETLVEAYYTFVVNAKLLSIASRSLVEPRCGGETKDVLGLEPGASSRADTESVAPGSDEPERTAMAAAFQLRAFSPRLSFDRMLRPKLLVSRRKGACWGMRRCSDR